MGVRHAPGLIPAARQVKTCHPRHGQQRSPFPRRQHRRRAGVVARGRGRPGLCRRAAWLARRPARCRRARPRHRAARALRPATARTAADRRRPRALAAGSRRLRPLVAQGALARPRRHPPARGPARARAGPGHAARADARAGRRPGAAAGPARAPRRLARRSDGLRARGGLLRRRAAAAHGDARLGRARRVRLWRSAPPPHRARRPGAARGARPQHPAASRARSDASRSIREPNGDSRPPAAIHGRLRARAPARQRPVAIATVAALARMDRGDRV